MCDVYAFVKANMKDSRIIVFNFKDRPFVINHKMDFLKAEIARKKKQMEKIDVMQPNKTYFKRGDLAAKQEEEYWKKHKRLKV